MRARGEQTINSQATLYVHRMNGESCTGPRPVFLEPYIGKTSAHAQNDEMHTELAFLDL